MAACSSISPSPPMSIAANLTAYTHSGAALAQRNRARSARAMSTTLRVATPNIEREVRNLSGGNQQKVLLAKWLARRAAHPDRRRADARRRCRLEGRHLPHPARPRRQAAWRCWWCRRICPRFSPWRTASWSCPRAASPASSTPLTCDRDRHPGACGDHRPKSDQTSGAASMSSDTDLAPRSSRRSPLRRGAREAARADRHRASAAADHPDRRPHRRAWRSSGADTFLTPGECRRRAPGHRPDRHSRLRHDGADDQRHVRSVDRRHPGLLRHHGRRSPPSSWAPADAGVPGGLRVGQCSSAPSTACW